MPTAADNYWLSAAGNATAVTTSDSAKVTFKSTSRLFGKGLYVGGAGNIKVTLADQKDSEAVTLNSVPAGTFLPISVSKVWATGTTATNMVVFY